jgi:purine-binding chemotaxis protein CheW
MTDTLRDSGGEGREFITCRIGEDEYCVEITSVREIRGWTSTTRLPHTPSYICGVINLRGAVLPVIDLSARLGKAAISAKERNVIIVIEVSGQTVGLLVDAVSDILCVSDEEMHVTPSVASETAREYVLGLITIENRMIRILNLDRLMPPAMSETA